MSDRLDLHLERFLGRLPALPANQCWEWPGGVTNSGYGSVWMGERRCLQAHRVAYEHFIGPIPPGLFVCHRCDNRKCCNPAHLFVGNATDNARDMASKGRAHGQHKTHCPRGHEYNSENTYLAPGHVAQRRCRPCNNVASSAYRKRRRA